MASFHLLYAFVIMPNRMYTFHHHRIQFHKGLFLTDTAKEQRIIFRVLLLCNLTLEKVMGRCAMLLI